MVYARVALLVLGTAFCGLQAEGRKVARVRVSSIERSGRFLARVPLPARSSTGLNYETYLFEMEGTKAEPGVSVVKLSYRFDLRDPEIPESLLDYKLVHRVRMTRDESCDEKGTELSRSYVFDEEGRYKGTRTELVPSKDAPALPAMGQTMLPCYAVLPGDVREQGHTGQGKAGVTP